MPRRQETIAAVREVEGIPVMEMECTRVVDQDLLERYLARQLAAEEEEQLESHWMSCDECWQTLQRALEVHAAFDGAVSGSALPQDAGAARLGMPGGKHRYTRQWWSLAAAAAIAAIAVGTLRDTRWRSLPSADTTRRGAKDALHVRAGGSPDVLTATWSPVADADVYQVRLLTADGSLLVQRNVSDTTVAIHADSLAALDRGGTMYWDVQALDQLRKPIAHSGLTEARFHR
jgi:hypothetical protein